MYVVFIGPPGAGKGTQSDRLLKYLNIPYLSTGAIFRSGIGEGAAFAQEAKRYVEAGQLVPDDLVSQMVYERLAEPEYKNGCLFDGFPRTIGQAKGLDAFLEKKQTPLRLVLELRVDDQELIKRLSGRGRNDDAPETIAKRLEVFATQTRPVLDYYQQRNLLASIEGIGTPDEVFGRIKEQIDALPSAGSK